MYELKKYFGDRVQSLTYDNDQLAFSVGIISPGEYQFGAIKKEIYTVTSGMHGVLILLARPSPFATIIISN